MEFYAPQRLFLLLIPAALFVWELARHVRAAAIAHPKIQRAEASARHLTLTTREHAAAASGSATAARPPSFFAKIKGARPLLYLGLALGVVALARPQYGQREIPVFEQSREVLIALDLSRSMLAEDIKPTRLARAKLLISSLLERLAGERVGLVLFSGTAFLQSPLSADYEILRDFLPELGPDSLPEGGTNYRALLDTALQAFSDTPATDRFLIVLSDGESTDDTWQRAIDALKKRGIRTLALGIGTPGGAMLPDGEGGFIKDERGAIVLSKLEPATLRQLAQETSGLYRDASTWLDLAALIRETVEQGQRGQFTDTHIQRLIDRYQWVLAPALLLLALSFWLEFPVKPRARALTLRPAHVATKTAARASAAALLPLLGLFWVTPADLPAQHTGTAGAASELSAIGKIVSRLATKTTAPTGRDWAELARETVTWGQKLQTEQHPVPHGPVHDALRAAQLGEALDPKTADWPELRRELEALLATPPEQEQQQGQQQPPPQNSDSNESQNQQGRPQGGAPDQSPPSGEGDSAAAQDSQNSQSSQDDQGGRDGSDSQNSPQPPESPSNASSEAAPATDTQDPSSPPPTQDPQQPQAESQQPQPRAGESAFGDMQQDAAPPAPPEPSAQPEPPAAPPPAQQGQTKQVGGTQSNSAPAPEAQDPALSAPLQKLQKIRNDDSPAHLFQMMNDDAPKETPSNRKNW